MNLTPGGLFGYASSKCMTNLNVPSSKGVSAGPIITAFLFEDKMSKCDPTLHDCVLLYHVITLSGTGEADTPAGGSVCMRCGLRLASCSMNDRHT